MGVSGAAAAGRRTDSGGRIRPHIAVDPLVTGAVRVGLAAVRRGEDSSSCTPGGHSGMRIELFSNIQSSAKSHVFHGGGVPEVKALSVAQLRKAGLQV